MLTSGSTNTTYIEVDGVYRRQPSYQEILELLKDTLDNLRLMRQLNSLPI